MQARLDYLFEDLMIGLLTLLLGLPYWHASPPQYGHRGLQTYCPPGIKILSDKNKSRRNMVCVIAINITWN